MEALPPPPPAVILHLDVNKTLIMVDPASGADLDDVVNGILASSSYGAVVPGEGKPSWELSSELLTLKGSDNAVTCTSRQSPRDCCISYDRYIKLVLHPYRHAAPDASAEERAAAGALNKVAKATCHQKLARFTHSGQPGASLQPVAAALRAKLAIDSATTPILRGLQGGSRFLLPCYFELLRHLTVERRSPFAIVIRTFGSDADRVIEEHNAWVHGEHPLEAPGWAAAPPPYATPLAFAGLAIGTAHTGAFSRCGPHSRDTALAAVITSHGEEAAVGAAAARAAAVPLAVPLVRIVRGYSDIHEHIMGLVRGEAAAPPTVAGAVHIYRDDWTHWFAHGERAHAGKLLTLREDNDHGGGGVSALPPPFQLFVDDNIGAEWDAARILRPEHVEGLPIQAVDTAAICAAGADRADETRPGGSGSRSLPPPPPHMSRKEADGDASIVDARLYHRGSSSDPADADAGGGLGHSHAHWTMLPLRATRGVHLARADPLSAILNPRYLVDLLQACEANWRRRREVAEARDGRGDTDAASSAAAWPTAFE